MVLRRLQLVVARSGVQAKYVPFVLSPAPKCGNSETGWVSGLKKSLKLRSRRKLPIEKATNEVLIILKLTRKKFLKALKINKGLRFPQKGLIFPLKNHSKFCPQQKP